MEVAFAYIQSQGVTSLAHPALDGLAAQTGDIYIHEESGTKTRGVWVLGKDNQWKAARTGDTHPNKEDYHLYIDKAGRPTWVTRKTLQTYTYREKSAGTSAVA